MKLDICQICEKSIQGGKNMCLHCEIIVDILNGTYPYIIFTDADDLITRWILRLDHNPLGLGDPGGVEYKFFEIEGEIFTLPIYISVSHRFPESLIKQYEIFKVREIEYDDQDIHMRAYLKELHREADDALRNL